MAADLGAPSFELPLRHGHTYNDISGHDSTRLHLGDSYVINNNAQASVQIDFAGHYSSTALHPVASYVPRPALQTQLEKKLHDTIEQRDGTSKILVVCGLGGAGKSQLMLSYVGAYRADYTAVFWLDAGSKIRLEADYMQVRNLLYSPKRTDLDIGAYVAEIKQWCHSKRGKWLFVLDSADDIEFPDTPSYINLRKFIVDIASADVVITTRCQSAKGMTTIDAIQVSELTPAEARDLFLRRSKLPNGSPRIYEEIDEITEELGHFALAVSLAAAYISQTARLRMNPKIYLDEYRTRRKDMLAQPPKHLVDQYSASVLTTWEQSHAAMYAECQEACELLTLLAFMSPEGICLDLFALEDERTTERYSEILCVENSHASVQRALDRAFDALSSYSLILWRDQQQEYSIHRLVHAWAYERLDDDQKAVHCIEAIGILCSAVSCSTRNPGSIELFLSHIMTVFAKTSELWESGTLIKSYLVEALGDLATYLHLAGRYPQAYQFHSLLHDYRHEQRQSNPEAYLDNAIDMARALIHQLKLDEAVQVLESLYGFYERSSGSDLDVTHHRYILARAYVDLGRYNEAEYLLREGLALNNSPDYQYQIRPENVMRLGSLLAFTLSRNGRPKEAEDLGRQALISAEALYGENHNEAFSGMKVLGQILEKREKFEEAEDLYRRALRGDEIGFGVNHPTTLLCAHRLGVIRLRQDAHEEAEGLIRGALLGFERLLGPVHKRTIDVLWDLAIVLRRQQSYSEALRTYRRAFDRSCEAFGTGHSWTSEVLGELESLESFLEARAMFETESSSDSMSISKHLSTGRHMRVATNTRKRAFTDPGPWTDPGTMSGATSDVASALVHVSGLETETSTMTGNLRRYSSHSI